jgi:hypothetical protein
MNWRDNLIDDSAQIRVLLSETKTIAVLGIKTEMHAGQPALYVPSYMQSAGFKIIPVPVYYPDVTEILGEKVYRKLADIPGESGHGKRLSSARRTFRRTSKTFWRSNQNQCGSSWESVTMKSPNDSPRLESRWCRIAVSWWTTDDLDPETAEVTWPDHTGSVGVPARIEREARIKH